MSLAESHGPLLRSACLIQPPIIHEGVPFCGFRFRPGLRPRILGATKRRFECRRRHLAEAKALRRLTQCVFAWYQFSREGNSQGLRRAYAISRTAIRAS